MYKQIFKNILFFLISLFLLVGLFYYQVLEKDLFLIVKLILVLLFFFNMGYILEVNTKKNYKRSIIFLLGFIISSIVLSLINHSFLFKQLIYFIIISLITLLGSFIENRKKRN